MPEGHGCGDERIPMMRFLPMTRWPSLILGTPNHPSPGLIDMVTRRGFLTFTSTFLAVTWFPLSSGTAVAAALPIIYRDPGCGCCHRWAQHMAEAGLPVSLVDHDDLPAVHARLGVPEALRGCHAGEIGGYVIEGHVPPADITRLLRERPEARGLSVAGMPQGSPGMETDGTIEPYDVRLFKADGSSVLFAHYG